MAEEWRLTQLQEKLGKETPWESPPSQESSLRLGHLSDMQSTLKDEDEEKKKKLFPTCCSHLLRSPRKCECVWAHSWTSFGRREQIPNVLVIYANHPSHPQLQSPNPHAPAHLLAKPPPQHSFPSCREIIKCYSHVAASASLYLSPACARALVAAAASAAFPAASETNLHRQRWFSSGLLCLRFSR